MIVKAGMELDPVAPENIGLCQVFADMYHTRKEQGEPFRAKAYYHALKVCEDFPEPITKIEQLQKVRGIGPKILARVKEYLSGEKPDIPDVPDALTLFQQIEGVGPVTAKKWYDRGFRELADLPLTELTTAQKIGVQFYDDINARIPRVEIEDFERYLRRYLRRDEIDFVIAGSYRRGKLESGDIDILVRFKEGALETLLACPLFTHTIAKGPKKWRGLGLVYKRQRRIDVEIVQLEEYPFALLYFTGSARHNVMMRETARQLGYRLNEKGLFDRLGERVAGLQTEADVYKFLGMAYLEPVNRN